MFHVYYDQLSHEIFKSMTRLSSKSRNNFYLHSLFLTYTILTLILSICSSDRSSSKRYHWYFSFILSSYVLGLNESSEKIG